MKALITQMNLRYMYALLNLSLSAGSWDKHLTSHSAQSRRKYLCVNSSVYRGKLFSPCCLWNSWCEISVAYLNFYKKYCGKLGQSIITLKPSLESVKVPKLCPHVWWSIFNQELYFYNSEDTKPPLHHQLKIVSLTLYEKSVELTS